MSGQENIEMDSNTRTRDNKGKEEMGSEDDCELPGPDLNKTKLVSSSGRSLASWWWAQLRMQMRLVRSALKNLSTGSQLDVELHKLLLDCLALYNSSTSPEISTDKDLSHVILGKHSSSLEAAFTWLGGWRPTSALVLVYSALGDEIQGKQLSSEALQAMSSVLSDEQLSNMNNLQKHTQKAEHELSSQFAIFQMLVTDQIMVKALVSKDASSEGNYSEALKVIESKIEILRELLKRADNLRLQTLQELFNLLSPVQSAKCSIAAYELVFAIKALSITRSRDSFSVKSAILLEGTDLYDPKCSSSTVGDNPFSTFNRPMESLHFQDARGI
ncbi:hypothetical protein O6H91_18G017600 [Diphasiastrum complanatum]|uniref:Uncharacterized protein n=1 Tax=Diphasiastrum complanatum TaxID=34168 RepID=A0ACC2AZQ0_DIPCM|nr:hypothetical protein O6H91_18G017600 [Diphasiastrum complanatum]